MASIWLESLGRSFEQALDLLAAALRDCTDELWETTMWQVPAPDPDHELLSPDEKPVTDPAQRSALVQRHSTPWGVAWHALECLDYDLNGEFVLSAATSTPVLINAELPPPASMAPRPALLLRSPRAGRVPG